MGNATLCGPINIVVTSTWNKLLGLFGIVGIITLIITIAKLISSTKEVAGVFEQVVTFLGVSQTVGFWLWCIAVYALCVYVVWALWYDDCEAAQSGTVRCASGVVNAVRGEDVNLVFNAKHPSIDVVVKSRYWPLVSVNADTIICSDAGSPILMVFFKSSRICTGKMGAAIGGTAAGIGGIIAGAIAGAAIGCATVILCVVALIVAALIVVAAVIIGAVVGGEVGAATQNEDPASYDDGNTVKVGDYVSAQGPTAINGNFDGAVVQYFNQEIALLSRSQGAAPFSCDDPDANIPDDMEACPFA